MAIETITWIGIALLVVQSGTFSGLNLALFGVSALRLDVLANLGDKKAIKVLKLRRDSNFVLTTILWGNVGTNVLLTLLADSVMFGVGAFLFSTFVITFGGEIIPQAYFSRNALRMASLLSPFLRFYQILLYPFAKSSAIILDLWLGKETIDFLPEAEIKEALKSHLHAVESEIGHVEGQGAINFLSLDDMPITKFGEPIDPDSVLKLPYEFGKFQFPNFNLSAEDPFVKQVQASKKRWVIFCTENGIPKLALDASSFLREVFFSDTSVNPMDHCHYPLIVSNDMTELDEVIQNFKANYDSKVIENDVIILWGTVKRIITGADILGFLLRGVAKKTVTILG